MDLNSTFPWQRYPLTAQLPSARTWLTLQINLGLAASTLDAYSRSLEDYLTLCQKIGLGPGVETVSKETIALYIRDLATRPNLQATRMSQKNSPALSLEVAGLANATMQQRLTVVRLYYDYLQQEGLRSNNPVGRGRYTPGNSFGGQRQRGLIPHFHRLPWIPTKEEWQAFLAIVKHESLRTRFMLALSYDAALRREELCKLQTGDIDPAHRLIQLRAETTKNRQARVVPFSEVTGRLYAAYLLHRRELNRERGLLFLSESRRNNAKPLSKWTWSKVVRAMADQAGLPQFSTHTLRHLCLTDLARAGWDIHEIASFAGHRNTETTLLYIHLSGRELSAKYAAAMASNDLHQRRVGLLGELKP